MPKNKNQCCNLNCVNYVSLFENRTRDHINICQDPSDHKFCSLDCKREWIYRMQGVSKRRIIKAIYP